MKQSFIVCENKKVADELEKELAEFSDETGIIHSISHNHIVFNAVKEFQSGAYVC